MDFIKNKSMHGLWFEWKLVMVWFKNKLNLIVMFVFMNETQIWMQIQIGSKYGKQQIMV